MNLQTMQALSPLIALAVTAIVTMLVIGFRRNLLLTTLLSSIGLVVSIALLALAATANAAAPLLSLDRYALYYLGLLFAAGLAVAVISYGYFKQRIGEREEYFVLLLLAILGSATIVASSHFVSFFLGLEILSVSLYSMIAYTRLRALSVEAGLKYLVLASTSAALLLMGIALIYAELGTLDFADVARAVAGAGGRLQALVVVGTVLLLVGIGFKLAVVPFHMWTPDVYEGAPAPVTAFIATVSKGAVVALLLRYTLLGAFGSSGQLFLVFVTIAVASMLAGNLLALWQSNVKRMLAYSSIGHLGYLLVAYLSGGATAATAVTFYLVAYFATTLAAFGVVTALSGREHDRDNFDDYRGLAWRRPYLGGVLCVALLSLAGIPLTAGFVGKFYVAMAGIGASLWLLVGVLVAGSVISLANYLRLVATMFLRPDKERIEAPSFNRATGVVLGVTSAIVLWLGIDPAPMLDLIESVAVALG